MKPLPGAARRLPSPAPLLAVLILALAAPAGAAGWSRLTLPGGDEWYAEVMRAPDEKHRGLMGRESMPDDRLMLFHYDADGVHRVWMKGCRFPIDVAWLAADGTVVAVAEGLPPCRRDPCPQYGPDAPTRYFVEGNAGWLRARGVAVGARIGVGPVTDDP